MSNYRTWEIQLAIQCDIYAVAGEAIAIRDCVYIEPNNSAGTAGRIYRTDAGTPRKSSSGFVIGFAVAAIAAGATGKVRLMGVMGGFSSLTAGAIQYASTTAGGITETQPNNSVQVAIALSTTQILIGNIGSQVALAPFAKGYFSGGISGAVSVYYATTDLLAFSTDTTTACSTANLSIARESLAGVSEGGKGYFAGGWTGSGPTDTADKVMFATDVTAACTSANVSQDKTVGAGLSDTSTKGYFAGGYTSIAYLVKADKITFSSDSTAACTTANLSEARESIAGVSEGSTKGYFAGGVTSYNGGPPPAYGGTTTADKVTFSSDSTAACTTADLPAARAKITGFSNGSTKGYCLGGVQLATVYANAYKITFSIDSTSAITTANLTDHIAGLAGFSDGPNNGYTGGGQTGTYRAEAVDMSEKTVFSSDTTSAVTTADLSAARISLAAFSGSCL